jgi:hypothetical protein
VSDEAPVRDDDEAVDWDRPPAGAQLIDLSSALGDARLESIGDTLDDRTIALRFDVPRLRTFADLPKTSRFALVIGAARAARVLDWIAGSVTAPASRERAALEAFYEERRRLGRYQSLGWRAFVSEVTPRSPLEISIAVMLRGGAGGVALRLEGMVGSEFRDVIVAGESVTGSRTDDPTFDLDAWLALGAELDEALAAKRAGENG